MNTESPLKNKLILAVDDEPDVLDSVEELLDMCTVHKAVDYSTAVQFLSSNSYDAVVLDIMGVNGFELLKISDLRGFPTVMLTGHAMTPEALKKSIELGAISFLTKELMLELKDLLEDVVLGGGKRLWWLKSFDRLTPYFDDKFGADWKEKDKFFKDFERSLKKTKIRKNLCFWFEEIGTEFNNIVGKKCANLGEMTRMGLPVPPGFVISIDTYRRFIRETGASEEILRYAKDLGELKGKGISEFEKTSKTIRGIIEAKDIPPDIKNTITAYYSELCEKTGLPDMAVSVRSAGTASRPGMFETFLNVKGIDDVLDKIKIVWSSAYTPRSMAFRINKDIPVLGDELGIAIPKMVNARASGIGFTVNPVNGDSSKIIIESNWGLGEGVVSGTESIDGFVVDKENLEIINKHVGKKEKCVMNMEKGAEWTEVPANMQNIVSISDEEIKEIAKIAKSLEETAGCAQDMEWAIDQDLPFPQNIFYLQTRPAKVAVKKSESASEQLADKLVSSFKQIDLSKAKAKIKEIKFSF
jgi:pyruvate, water dikinase